MWMIISCIDKFRERYKYIFMHCKLVKHTYRNKYVCMYVCLFVVHKKNSHIAAYKDRLSLCVNCNNNQMTVRLHTYTHMNIHIWYLIYVYTYSDSHYKWAISKLIDFLT